MPLENPSIINKATRIDGDENPICDECAARLENVEVSDISNCPIYDWNRGERCLECLAFNERRHPAMFSEVRTIAEIQRQIEYYRDYPPDGLSEIERQVRIDTLEWVLGEGRHAS